MDWMAMEMAFSLSASFAMETPSQASPLPACRAKVKRFRFV